MCSEESPDERRRRRESVVYGRYMKEDIRGTLPRRSMGVGVGPSPEIRRPTIISK